MYFVLYLYTNQKSAKIVYSVTPFKYLPTPFLSRYINLYSPTNSGRTPTNNVVTTRRGTCRLPVHIPRFSHMIHLRGIKHARTNAPLVAYWLNFRVRAPYIVSARGSPTLRPALEPESSKGRRTTLIPTPLTRNSFFSAQETAVNRPLSFCLHVAFFANRAF